VSLRGFRGKCRPWLKFDVWPAWALLGRGTSIACRRRESRMNIWARVQCPSAMAAKRLASDGEKPHMSERRTSPMMFFAALVTADKPIHLRQAGYQSRKLS
jgi:hypothetical protein